MVGRLTDGLGGARADNPPHRSGGSVPIMSSQHLKTLARPSGLHGGHATRGTSPSTHERPAEASLHHGSTLSSADRASLEAQIRSAPVIPSPLLRDPAIAALTQEARHLLTRGTGRTPEDLELDARILPGSKHRVVLFRDATGRSTTLTADAPVTALEARGIGRALADFKIVAGAGMGFRVIPGVFSAGAMGSVGRLHPDGLSRHLRAGASTSLGGAAFVWEFKDRLEPVGASAAVSAPFLSSGYDPVLGDRVEVSVPGYVTVLAAVKRGETRGDDVGWLGVVWHQGLLGAGPGPTINTKLIVGHPALAGPLRPAVDGASAVISPIMTRVRAMMSGTNAATSNDEP